MGGRAEGRSSNDYLGQIPEMEQSRMVVGRCQQNVEGEEGRIRGATDPSPYPISASRDSQTSH